MIDDDTVNLFLLSSSTYINNTFVEPIREGNAAEDTDWGDECENEENNDCN